MHTADLIPSATATAPAPRPARSMTAAAAAAGHAPGFRQVIALLAHQLDMEPRKVQVYHQNKRLRARARALKALQGGPADAAAAREPAALAQATTAEANAAAAVKAAAAVSAILGGVFSAPGAAAAATLTAWPLHAPLMPAQRAFAPPVVGMPAPSLQGAGAVPFHGAADGWHAAAPVMGFGAGGVPQPPAAAWYFAPPSANGGLGASGAQHFQPGSAHGDQFRHYHGHNPHHAPYHSREMPAPHERFAPGGVLTMPAGVAGGGAPGGAQWTAFNPGRDDGGNGGGWSHDARAFANSCGGGGPQQPWVQLAYEHVPVAHALAYAHAMPAWHATPSDAAMSNSHGPPMCSFANPHQQNRS